jgi:hypothetical protein
MLGGQLKAQTTVWGVSYEYDAAGNRTQRMMKTLFISTTKSASADDSTEFNMPLEEEVGVRQIILYPNPTKGMLKVTIIGGEDNDRYQATVYDQNGRLVLQRQLTGDGDMDIDLTNKSTGYFFLNLLVNDERKSYKIIKE